jgi:signal transduction histidine kinase
MAQKRDKKDSCTQTEKKSPVEFLDRSMNQSIASAHENYAQEVFEDASQLDSVVNSLENCGYCATMLLNLINDLMDLAKLEKMKFSLNNDYFDLTKTINGAFGTLSYFGK